MATVHWGMLKVFGTFTQSAEPEKKKILIGFD